MFILQASSFNNFKIVASILILLFPTVVFGECTCDSEDGATSNKDETLKYKLGSIASILVFGAVGVSLPLLSKKIPSLRPDKNIFFLIKAFAAGVILATAFIHILPDAFETLTSPCLKENPWGKFPFTGFVCMMSAIGTLMIDSLATGYYKRSNMKTSQVEVDEESIGVHDHHDHGADHAHGHAHTHGSNNAHGSSEVSTADLIRHRVISQVLELGILVHSVIIGISLGASQNPETIKPLLVALSFHQFFEGMGLGGYISQAQFKSFSAAIMAVFFSLTTPVGIAVGIGISHVYSETSPTALIVQGTLDAAAAGILIYMSLVDLLAADFMSPRMQQNAVIQLGSYTSLLLGAGCMSLLAKWA